MTAAAPARRVRQPHAALRAPLRGRDGDDRARLAAADVRGRRALRPSRARSGCSARPASRSTTRASSGSIPTSCSSRSRSRPASSSSRPQPAAAASRRRRPHGLHERRRGRRSCTRTATAARRDDGRLRALRASSRTSTRRSTRRAACAASPTTCRSTRATSTCSWPSQTLTDKPYMGALFTGGRRATRSRMTDIAVRRPDEPTARGRASYGSPTPTRRCTSTRAMVEVMFAYAEANQANVVTPFLLMGAMSPVTIPAALVQQTVEALAGSPCTQLIRPGAPVVLGSFLSHTDMQSGSPGFGGPESATRPALLGPDRAAPRPPLASRRRRSDVEPAARRPGGVRGAEHDQPAFLSGANLCCTRPAGSRAASSRATRSSSSTSSCCGSCSAEFTPLEIDEESLAFDAHLEVGHGGHFLGAAHTLERFRDCFYRPISRHDVELRALEAGRRAGDDRARRQPLARGARALRAAADRRRHPRRAPGVRRAEAARAG